MIEIRALSKRFTAGSRTVTVLDDVSLCVPHGSITGVIGTSGAGKTTLLRCVNRLETPDSGLITFGDTTVTAAMSRRDVIALRRRIGMVFQSSSLLAHRTAAGNVSYPLEVEGLSRSARRRRVGELLERVGLSSHAKSYPSQLSGGQRQRVGIARALALNAPTLLSDEATSGLDPATTRSILTLLRELRDDLDLTILLITHEMDVVRRYCDRAALLSGGSIVDHGAVVDLAADPASALGRQLFPRPPQTPGHAGEAVLSLTLGREPGREDWLADLAIGTGVRARLLAASIEGLHGHTVGLATIALPVKSERDCRKWLHANGVHVE